MDSSELARRFLAALSAGDQAAVGELVHPEVEIRTERTVHRGRVGGDGSGRARSSTTWSAATSRWRSRRPTAGCWSTPSSSTCGASSGEVGDTSRVAIELGIRDGLISSWYLLDEPSSSGPLLGLTAGPSLYANRSKR